MHCCICIAATRAKYKEKTKSNNSTLWTKCHPTWYSSCSTHNYGFRTTPRTAGMDNHMDIWGRSWSLCCWCCVCLVGFIYAFVNVYKNGKNFKLNKWEQKVAEDEKKRGEDHELCAKRTKSNELPFSTFALYWDTVRAGVFKKMYVHPFANQRYLIHFMYSSVNVGVCV